MPEPIAVASGVYVFPYAAVTVNSILIVGDRSAVIVDTLATDDQARDLFDAVRRITGVPLILVNTHAHFDHCLGNDALVKAGAGEIWAHESAARALREDGPRLRRDFYAECLADYPDLADGVARAALCPPDRTVHTLATIDLGDRSVELRHVGPGHTDGDLVVQVPDVNVLISGDLVESAGPPAFEDSYPVQWPEALALILDPLPAGTVVVPGHGPVVDVDFVQAQHDQLTDLAWLIREGHQAGALAEAVAAKAPFDFERSLIAVRRGFAELSGQI